MGIENNIARMCKQKAVYWSPLVSNGSGGMTFSDPIEIDCRWERKIELIENNQGKEVISRASIYTTTSLVEQGYLLLGTLDDLDSDGVDRPREVLNTYEIKKVDASPSMKGDVYLYKAYL